MEKIIKVKNLNYITNGTQILKDINFDINKGEFISIIGPNGAGKTTLMKCLSDNLDYTGNIDLKGKPIKEYSKKEKAKIISVVPQEYVLPFNFKVIDVVKMGRNPYREKNSIKNFRDVKECGVKLAGFSDSVGSANEELKSFLKNNLYTLQNLLSTAQGWE